MTGDAPSALPIYLVACVSQKLDRRAPAADLYRSDWFRKARTYVEETGARWYVLSAAHGLVEPTKRLAPYDATLRELDRQSAIMRPRTPLYHRFEATARQLTPERIRASRDIAAIARLVARLAAARYPGVDLHGLERVWNRAELGTLIVEATNRKTLLDLGRTAPRIKGPALDPRLLPDDRLAHLIQTHRDLAIVEALRAERERRRAVIA